MTEIKLIEIGEEIHSDNKKTAADVRSILTKSGTFLLNLMASPGAGKTSLIMNTLSGLSNQTRALVIEADIDSLVDAEKIVQAGARAVQIHTGGFCHVNAGMIMKTVHSLNIDEIDLLILENVGNLICPAQVDTGAHANAMILSVPEGDDKPLKYPLMFRSCEVLVVNKIDYLKMEDFDMEKLKDRVWKLNPDMKIFELSCKTGEGLDPWVGWLRNRIRL